MKILSGGIIKLIVLLAVGFFALNAILLLASNATLTLFLFVIPMVLTLIALNFSNLRRLASGTKKKLGSIKGIRFENKGRLDRLREIEILKDLQFYFYGNSDDVVIAKKGSQIAALGFLALKKVPKGFTEDLNGILKALYDENISLTYILIQNPAKDQIRSEEKNILYPQENCWNVQALIIIHKNMKGFLNLEEKCRTLTEEVRRNMFIVKTSFHTSFPECKIHKIADIDLIKALQLVTTGGGIGTGTGFDFFLQDYELASLIVSGAKPSSEKINWSSEKTDFRSHLSRDAIVRKAIQREFAGYMKTHEAELSKRDVTTSPQIRLTLLNEDFSDDELHTAAEILCFLVSYPESPYKHIVSAINVPSASKILNRLEKSNYISSFANSEGHKESERLYILTEKGETALTVHNEHYGRKSKELLALWSNIIKE